MPIRDYCEMLERETNNGKLPTRLLVIGEGGSGKSTLTAKIAHEWVKGKVLQDIALLFVLNLRKMSESSTLEDAIFEQLMPKDVGFSKEELLTYIIRNQDKVMIIFDSYDEFCRKRSLEDEPRTNVIQTLSYEILIKCRVMVTSRPWKQNDFLNFQREYTTFEVSGFTQDQVESYVKKFFKNDPSLAESLLTYLKRNDFCPGIASVPLMTQLFCMYWMKNNNADIPDRIGELYNRIISSLWKHQKSKAAVQCTPVPFSCVLRELGKKAFHGLWPPENKLVFTRQELDESTSHDQTVEIAIEVGLLSTDDNLSIEPEYCGKDDNIFDDESETSPSYLQHLRFFHKTIQEKCAGVFLAREKPTETKKHLEKLTTVNLCLKVQMILQFACGVSLEATKLIMARLEEVFKSHIRDLLPSYYRDELAESQVRMVQQFIELCLICNYESGAKKEFHDFVNSLFPNGNMRFLGISAYMGSALEHFLTFNNNTRSITIVEMPRNGDTVYYLGKSKILQDAHREEHKKLKNEKSSKLKEMHDECINKKILPQHSSNISNALGDVQIWERFSNLQPSSDINFTPVVRAFSHIHLFMLDITDVKLGKQCETLISCIEKEHLTTVVKLMFRQIGLTQDQVDRLVVAMEKRKLPVLKALDMSRNNAGIPKELGRVVHSLQMTNINVSFMTKDPQDTSKMTSCLQDYGPHLEEYRIEGNPTNQEVGDALLNALPNQLQNLGIDDVSTLERDVHKEMLTNLQRLQELRELRIWGITIYLDDVLGCVAEALPALPHLSYLSLRAEGAPKTTSASFERLLKVLEASTSIRKLRLYGIYVDQKNFKALVDIGRKHSYEYLW